MSDVPLPAEVLAAILSRLPVDSLLRFRCVSKPWLALIDSEYFIKLHLKQSIEDKSHVNVTFSTDDALYYLDMNLPSRIVKKIDHPVGSLHKLTIVFGSCNGVLCLSSMGLKSNDEMALLNPLTRKCKIVPMRPPSFPVGSVRRNCFDDFGYDCVNDDYKLVRLVQCCYKDLSLDVSKVEVYSSKSGQWREVRFPFYICTQQRRSVFASGALHWWVSHKPEPEVELLIGAFHLTTEECRLVPQPDFSNKDFMAVVCTLGGCLCMVCQYAEKTVDLWVMKSYGVKDSWTKLISIMDVMVTKNLEIVRPIMYSKSGREVLFQLNFNRLIWYDLEKKKVKNFMVDGAPELFFADAFLGSLVQVKTGEAGGVSGSVARKEPREDKSKNTKRRDDFLSSGFKLVL